MIRRLFQILGFAALAITCARCAWWDAVRSGDFPQALLDKHPATSLIVTDANGFVLRQEAASAGSRENWTPLDKISPYLVDATLASEDNDFEHHRGVDWSAMARAAWLNLRGGEFGGSTITMQLVRIVANPPRSLSGKYQQMILAERLERTLSKREILEQYFNRVYYGNGAWGAEQAAKIYFGKHASELSAGEAAMLAVMPRGPKFYDPFAHWQRVVDRRAHILALMEAHGRLSHDDRTLAERVPLDLSKNTIAFRAPHFVEWIKDRAPSKFARAAKIETTLDWDLQKRLETALQLHLDRLSGKNVTQAALIVMRNSDGAVLGMIGSRRYDDARGNGAFSGVTARLRPGSTLKTFVYGTAIEHGDTPASIAYDVALPEDAHQDYTKDVRAHGWARYRESLAGSFNLSAVHTLQRVGIAPVLQKLRTAGLDLDRPDADYDWGLAIGHAETRLVELVSAFSTFGRGGVPIAPRAIAKATALDGSTWEEPTTIRDRVFSEEVAYLIFDILRDPDARKPMFGDRVPMNLPFPVALKTGTTKAFTDLWAIGVTSEYTIGVWAGNFDGQPTHHVMSSEGATPLLRAAYTAVAARFGAPTAPPRPDDIVAAEICPVSGQRPGPYCEHHKRELFIAGHVPEATCEWHQLVCGKPTVVFPEALRGWAQYYGRMSREPASCEKIDPDAQVAIAMPVDGAHFVLEPYRAATSQRPPLAAVPPIPDLAWTIDGEPADRWVPTPGEHRVQLTHGASSTSVTIFYE